MSNDGQYCATCATGDRFISLWSLNLEKPNESAISVLVFDHFVKQLDIRMIRGGAKKKKEGGKMEVAGVSVDGEKVALWSAPLGTQTPKNRGGSIKAKGVISTPSRSSSPFLHCEFGKGEERNAVVLRGLRLKPVFDMVEVKKDDQFVSVEMEGLPAHLLTKKGEKKAKKEEVQKRDAAVVSGMSSKGMKKGEDLAQKSALMAKMEDDEEEAAVDVTVTDTRSFLEKLEALEKHVGKPGGEKKKGSGKENPKKAESLQVAIEQALHSDDPVMLEKGLEVTSETTIQNTCQRLSAPYVVPFLMALIKRFEANPNRAGRLVPWIRGVLIFHGSYLMTQPDLGFFFF